MAACGDEGPQGHSVADIKALPEAKLIVPDGEIVRELSNKGGTLPAYTDTTYGFVVRSDLDAEAVFAFYDSELDRRSWQFTRLGAQADFLLEARGHKEDFAIVLYVMDPETASSKTDWGGRATLYQLLIVAVKEKGE